MSIKDEIAKNILYQRKKSGLTQKELAERINVKNTSVSNWERGDNSIDIETLVKLCEVFNVSLNDMYGVYGKKEYYTEKENAIIKAFRNKDEGTQSAILKLLDLNSSAIADDMKSTIEKIDVPTKQK